ncbi:apolipoprotein B-100 isoform X1 [Tachyglossus aculeatus]|nr:apolipoprotein B-100 isoform X1 [Tachyglossus aculeatus]
MGPLRLLLLLLLLLLASGPSSQEEGSETPGASCPKDTTRFKHLRKYVYNYEAETTSGVTGTADSRSAAKINCKVELEVPQLCSFILKTSQCTLREVYGFNTEGKAMLKKTKNSEEFTTAMSKYELKLSVTGGKQVLLYPDKDEPTHILNIKRGIISALLLPPEMEKDQQQLVMETVYGNCSSHITVKARKGSTATEMAIERNLKKCDHFSPISGDMSPLALVRGLNTPLSTLIRSSQSCQYTVDNRRKHVSEVICTEKHLFLPFSHKNQYGMMTQVRQTLRLEDTPKINSRIFDEASLPKKGLAFEKTEDTPPLKQGEDVLKTLKDLQKLSATEQSNQRANLFGKLVTGLRGLNEEAMLSLLPKLIEVSSPVTLQALMQCGQPQCYSQVFEWLKAEKVNPLVVDAITYIVGLLPEPGPHRVRDIFKTAKDQKSRATFYALSHVVNGFYDSNQEVTQDLKDIAEYLMAQIGNECSGNEELTYLTLKVTGNMGQVMDLANPKLKSSILKCITNPTSSSVQKVAIQALRKMELTDEVRGVLLQTFQDDSSPVDKRLAAYLILMRDPSQSDVHKVAKTLLKDNSQQVKSFVASHLANILESDEAFVQGLKGKVEEALKGSQVPTAMDFRKFSRNYQISKTVSVPDLDPISAKVEANLIFDPNHYLPKEAILKTTLKLFDQAEDLFEIGLEGKGFEPTLEALFGTKGFFPDSATQALYWVDGKVPNQVSRTLEDHFGYSKDGKREQDMMKGIMVSIEKLVKEMQSKEAPEANAYLRILGDELGYLKLSDLKFLGRLLFKSANTLQTIPRMIAETLSKGSKNDLFVHYIFMDNNFDLPTGAGLPLQVAFSGIVAPGARAGMRLQAANMQAELIAKPAVSVEFVTHLGVVIPDFARSGVQMNSNLYHESGLEAQVTLKAGQLKLSIPSPTGPVKLFSVSNTLHLVSTTKTEVIPPFIENRQSWSTCKPFFTGLNYCTTVAYSNASSTDAAPFYPLTGDTRFEFDLQPTGEVQEYSASVNYESQKEGKDLVDSLKFGVQAEGRKLSEAAVIFRYNRGKKILTGDLQIPEFDVDFGANLRVKDESAQDKKAYTLTLDINNKKIPEITITGQMRFDGNEEGMIGGIISIPRLQAEARTETLFHQSFNKLTLQTDSSATAYGMTLSKKMGFQYDNEKMEFEWNTGSNTDTKKVAAIFPVDISKSLHQYANDLLDHHVAHTNMTFRRIVSNSIEATNTWLQSAAENVPYAQVLQNKLRNLQELNMEKMGLPDFQVPENLFLKSDGRIRYSWNENKFEIAIPVPFGGISSQDMKVPQSVRMPELKLESVGIHLPSQEFTIPPFAVPKSYQLQVPLLGVLELSTNVYSNLYNWSASYTGGNTSQDNFSLQSRYHVKADSIVDLLSYNIQGSGETTYDYKNTFTIALDGSLHHKFLDSHLKFNHRETLGNHPVSKGSLTFDSSSSLGTQVSVAANFDSKRRQHLSVKEAKIDGQLTISSFVAKSAYSLSYNRDVNTQHINGESNLQFNSPYLKGSNQITGRYADGALSITSASDLQSGTLKNTASLNYENSQLTLKSDTSGKFQDFVATNKVDLSLSRENAQLRSEYQSDYKNLRFYALLSSSLNSQGLELNADLLGTDQTNRGAHKATLRIGRDGLSTSATTNLRISPLILENEVNAGLGTSGALVKVTSNGRFREHNAKFTLDGRVGLTEIVLGSLYQATILGADSKNVFDFRINREGLKFSNGIMGSYKEIKLENSNNLNIAGLALDFTSKLENTIGSDKSYRHDFNFQLQPFSLLATLTNDFQFGALAATNHGKLRLEPLKLSLGGNVKGSYKSDEFKHIYTLTYADLAASYKADTIASIQGTEFSNRVNMGTAGLSSALDMSTSYNSKPLHFNNVFRFALSPFTITVDAHTTTNGKLSFLGEHTGQLYSKFLFKGEPLAFSLSHDFKGSSGHAFESGHKVNTGLENKVSALFTPEEQSSTWKLKTQLNENEYTQDFHAYNAKDKIGVEFGGRALSDLAMLDSPIKVPLLLTEPINLIDVFDLRDTVGQPQEFSLSGSVKYDKNEHVHVINLPFLESLPAYFQKFQEAILNTLKHVQKYLKSININQYVRKYQAALDKLPQQVNDYLNQYDLEGQVRSAKEKLIVFTDSYQITMDDLQMALDNAKINLEKILVQLQTYVIQFDQYIRNHYDLRSFKTAVTDFIDYLVKTWKNLDEHYKIRINAIKAIREMHLVVENIDVNKLGSATASWVQDLDAKYQIKAQIQEKLHQLKVQIQNIDIQHHAEKLKQQVQALDIKIYLDRLKVSFPLQRIKAIFEQIKDIIINLLEDYEVAEKVSVFRGKIHALIKKFEIDKQIHILMDKLVHLTHQYKLKETLQKLTASLKKIDLRIYFEKLVGFVDDAIKKAKTLHYDQLIDDVNQFLDMLIKKVAAFDYNQFVAETNNKILVITQKINDEIKSLELPQKVEAAKVYIADVNAVIAQCVEKLKDTKITVIIDWFRDLISSTSLDHLKASMRENLEDLRDLIYGIDIPREIQLYLQKAGQAYHTVVTYISNQWSVVAKEIDKLAEQYDMKNWAENLKGFVELGFTVPEIKTSIIAVPAFEVSLRALRLATFQTPAFRVPLTDLHIPSIQINIKKWNEIKVPSRFTTPEFTILDTFTVPSYTIDFKELKLRIVRTIDQMLSSELRWPLPEIYFRDLKMSDVAFSGITLPDFQVPEVKIPEIVIPKLNLNEFQVPDIRIPTFQLPQIPRAVALPAFGKLSAVFRITSPFFSLNTNAGVHNTTTLMSTPEFVASVTVDSKSKFDLLAFTFDASTHLSAPKMEKLILKQSVKFSQQYLKTQHESEVVFLGNSIQGTADSLASLHTEKNALELNNNMFVKLQKQVAFESNTKYTHKLNIPQADFSSQADLHNQVKALLEAGHVSIVSVGAGSWKWASPHFSEEGTHESLLKFNVEGPITLFDLSNQINGKNLKVNQKLAFESGFLNFAKFEVESEVGSQHLGQSVLIAKGSGLLGEMKLQLTGHHEANLKGKVDGTLRNDLAFLAQPFEISASTDNEGNIKVSFPLKLSGKIDFLNKYALVLNPGVQQVSWEVGGRFNQYRYNHNFSAGNNENSIEAQVEMNGDANLDFLSVPLDIPEQYIPLPFLTIQTPPVKDFSVWEKTGLKDFLKTTKQSFDLNVKAQYKKNKDWHAIPLPVGAVYEAIEQNLKSLNTYFEKGRDNALDFLTKSYNEAKIKFDKFKVEPSLNKLPRTFRIPGYTVPVVNIEVSPFTAELPAFGYMVPKEISTVGFSIPGIGFSVPSYTLVLPSLELPVLHIPNTLRTITLPRFRLLSTANNIWIPSMGNITYDFSFKSSIITLNTHAGLYNQSDIVAHFSSSSSSVFDALRYKLDGKTSLTRKRGLKLATALSLNNKFVEGNHDSTIGLTRRNMEASVTTVARVQTPILRMNFRQELNGNTKSKPTVSSSLGLKYDFSYPKSQSSAKGTLEHKLTLESLTSYFSVESISKGNMSGSVLSQKYSGAFTNEANTYLNSKGARSSVKVEGHSKADGVWNVEVKENFAGEASIRRLYAVWEHNGRNQLQLQRVFSTKGDQNSRVTLELGLWSVSTLLQIQASQPSSLLDEASISQAFLLNTSPENQQVVWRGEGHVQTAYVSHEVQLSNGRAEARMDIAGSVGGHMRFLKGIQVPVYDRSIWDLLKLDVTTSEDQKQYLKISTGLVYTKSKSGYVFPLKLNQLADGFTVPGLELEGLNFPWATPAFRVPFTTLEVPSYTLDFSTVKIPKKLSSPPFDLNLPSLPKVKFPKIDVSIQYTTPDDAQIPFFEITSPEYRITLSQFTLPKSVTIGTVPLDLNKVANKIADFDLPTISMPEQKIEIPSVKISLPAGIFIPSFGFLTGDFKVTSPLYNVTWSVGLKNEGDHIETSLDSTCSSTLQFLEYDINVVTTYRTEGDNLKGEETGTFSHRDFSAEYKMDFTLRGICDLHQNLVLGIMSPTFTNVYLNYTEDDDSVTISIASPPIGTLGGGLQTSGDITTGNLYFRPWSTPEREVNITEMVIFLEDSGVSQDKISWNEDAAEEVLNTLKRSVPKMTTAVYNWVDKYHQEHTGMDLRMASSRLKRSMQDSADRAYAEARKHIAEATSDLRGAAEEAAGTYRLLKDKVEDVYQDMSTQVDYQELKNKVLDTTVNVLKEYHKKIKHLIVSVVEFLRVTKFQLPGQSEKYTAEELYTMSTKEVREALVWGISKFQHILDIVVIYLEDLDTSILKDIKIKIPGFSRSIQGEEIIEPLKTLTRYFMKEIQWAPNYLQNVKFSEVAENLQHSVQKVFVGMEEAIESLKAKSFDDIKTEFHEMFSPIFNVLLPNAFQVFKEKINEYLAVLNTFVQHTLQEVSKEMQQLHQYMKDLREEYFDPSVVGWAVKYYEIEDKAVILFKNLLVTLKAFSSRVMNSTADLTSNLVEQVNEFISKEGQQYLNILTDANGKGKKMISELSSAVRGKIQTWAATARKSIAEYHEQFKVKVQDASEQISRSYETFAAETKRLVDLTIENFYAFLKYLTELLQKLQSETDGSINPYVQVSQGERIF